MLASAISLPPDTATCIAGRPALSGREDRHARGVVEFMPVRRSKGVIEFAAVEHPRTPAKVSAHSAQPRKRGRPPKDRTETPATAAFDEIVLHIQAVPRKRRPAAKEQALQKVGEDRRLIGSAALKVFLAFLSQLFWNKGSARVGTGEIASITGLSRRTVERAIRLLVECGHLVRQAAWRTPSLCDVAETTFPGVAMNFVTVPSNKSGGYRQTSRESTVTHVGVITYVSPNDKTNEEKIGGRNYLRETDGARFPGSANNGRAEQAENAAGSAMGTSGERLPFTQDVLAELIGHGIDIEALYQRFIERTRGRRIKDANAYFLKMGREEAAKRYGVSVDALKQAGSRNQIERASGLAAAAGALNRPSDKAWKSATRCNKPRAEAALAQMAGKSYPTQDAADRAFEAAQSNVRFHHEARSASMRGAA